jgi:LAS superfamily LD-carboxypeptidase LdcB
MKGDTQAQLRLSAHASYDRQEEIFLGDAENHGLLPQRAISLRNPCAHEALMESDTASKEKG